MATRAVKNKEQVGVWLPVGTKVRIKQLSRHEGEPLAYVLLRALDALEMSEKALESSGDALVHPILPSSPTTAPAPSEDLPQMRDELKTIRERLERVELALERTREVQDATVAPMPEAGVLGGDPLQAVPGTTSCYQHDKVKARALTLRAEGLKSPAIAKRLNQERWSTAKGGPWGDRSIRRLLAGEGGIDTRTREC